MTRSTKRKIRRLSSVVLMTSAILVAAPMATASAQKQRVAAPAAPMPIPQNHASALAKAANLPESQKTVEELVPGWTKPRTMLVAVDQPKQLAWLQEAASGVKLVAVPFP